MMRNIQLLGAGFGLLVAGYPAMAQLPGSVCISGGLAISTMSVNEPRPAARPGVVFPLALGYEKAVTSHFAVEAQLAYMPFVSYLQGKHLVYVAAGSPAVLTDCRAGIKLQYANQSLGGRYQYSINSALAGFVAAGVGMQELIAARKSVTGYGKVFKLDDEQSAVSEQYFDLTNNVTGDYRPLVPVVNLGIGIRWTDGPDYLQVAAGTVYALTPQQKGAETSDCAGRLIYLMIGLGTEWNTLKVRSIARDR